MPVGLLVDRARRIPLLAASIVLWSVATLLGAFAQSYSTLLLTRIGLGAVAATAGPAVASLTGDYFPSRERGRVYGFILGGEIAGAAAGFIISGNLASAVSWRVAFVLLALPGFALAWLLVRTVPEPLRAGQSRLAPGTPDLAGVNAAAREDSLTNAVGATPAARPADRDLAGGAARRRGFTPDAARLLLEDPARMSLRAAVRYVLSVPTNALLIISSALGYFYFTGLQAFLVVFIRGRYHAGQGTVSLVLGMLMIGALVGTLVSGPLTDRLLRSDRLEGRILVPAGCYVGAALVLIPGLLSKHLGTALWFDVAGAALISAANPPLDAARLDVMPSALWGRAESTRTLLRSIAQAIAPLAFGVIADFATGISPQQAPIGTHPHELVSSAAARGLQISFLSMLIALAAAGVVMFRARKAYPIDVATANAGASTRQQRSSVARAPTHPGPP
jgi:MFS family permease